MPTATTTMRLRASVTVLLALVALLTAAPQLARAEDECCSTCIGKVAPSVYDYDPLVFAQCSVANSKRVCCFNCGTMGDPTYGDTVSFASDGTTPVVKTGTWLKMKWSDVQNVTYIALKDGQKKTTTPTISDASASFKANYFMICAQSVGKIVLRGWGDQPCRKASLEKTVSVGCGSLAWLALVAQRVLTTGVCVDEQVVQGAAGATCEAAEPTKPDTPATTSPTNSGGSGSADTSSDTCNLQRASIKVVDGTSHPHALSVDSAFTWYSLVRVRCVDEQARNSVCACRTGQVRRRATRCRRGSGS